MPTNRNSRSRRRRQRNNNVNGGQANRQQPMPVRPVSTPADRMLMRSAWEAQGGTTVPRVPDIVPITFSSRGKVHTFVRTTVPQSIAVSSMTTTTGAVFFSLAQVPNSAEFTGLFDQYLIRQVTVNFKPHVSGLTSASGVYLPALYTVIDYDDTTLIPIAGMLQYETLVETQPGFSFSRTLTPRWASAAYDGTVFTSYGNTTGWIDSASPNVQHYGLKYYADIATGMYTAYDYTVTYVLQFRSTR